MPTRMGNFFAVGGGGVAGGDLHRSATWRVTHGSGDSPSDSAVGPPALLSARSHGGMDELGTCSDSALFLAAAAAAVPIVMMAVQRRKHQHQFRGKDLYSGWGSVHRCMCAPVYPSVTRPSALKAEGGLQGGTTAQVQLWWTGGSSGGGGPDVTNGSRAMWLTYCGMVCIATSA